MMAQTQLPLFPDQASTVAPRVDALYAWVVALATFFTLLVTVLLVYFAIKYRRRSDTEAPRTIHGSLPLEMIWTFIPLGLALVTFYWGAVVYFDISRPPSNAMDIYAVGKQWMWKFQHLEGVREINELHVPVGRPVRLTMATEDVIHSFFVPAFRVKTDLVPGRYTTVWFEPTKVGRYHLFCAEYCGNEHSGMIGWIIVMEPADYQNWLSGSSGGTLASRGERLFNDMACTSCHQAGSGQRGPSLGGLAGRAVPLRSGGTVVADDHYLRESILNPTARVVAGYEPIMPVYQGLIDEEGLLAILTYIKTLPPTGAAAAPPAGTTTPPPGPGESR